MTIEEMNRTSRGSGSGFLVNTETNQGLPIGETASTSGVPAQDVFSFANAETDYKTGQMTPEQITSLRAQLTANGYNADQLIAQWDSDLQGGTFPEDRPTGQLATPVPRVVPTPINPVGRDELISEQRAGDLRRRVYGDIYPQFSGTYAANRILPRLGSQFESFLPITNFMSGGQRFETAADEEAAFRAFLGGQRPTSAQLGQSLSGILGQQASGSLPPDLFSGIFTNQKGETQFDTIAPAFQAATLPYLQGMGPRFRGNMQAVMQNRLRDEMARNPQMFLTPEQIFTAFKQYIPDFEGFGTTNPAVRLQP